MHYIRFPVELTDEAPAVFLAGGISNTEDWQSVVAEELRSMAGAVINPRRDDYPDTETAAREQIAWEFRHLQRADLFSFWFPPQTLCPIALFELGAGCSSGVPLVVGADPEYTRRLDLLVQLSLRRPEVVLVNSLPALVKQIREHAVYQGTSR